jgi:hypothetical protein
VVTAGPSAIERLAKRVGGACDFDKTGWYLHRAILSDPHEKVLSFHFVVIRARSCATGVT